MINLVIVVASLSLICFKQPDTKDIIGTWRVSNVIVNKDSPMGKEKKLIAYAKPIMLKTVFIIKANHHFSMQSPEASQQMPDGIWTYDSKSYMLKVSEPGDPRSRLVEIMIFNDKNGVTCFL